MASRQDQAVQPCFAGWTRHNLQRTICQTVSRSFQGHRRRFGHQKKLEEQGKWIKLWISSRTTRRGGCPTTDSRTMSHGWCCKKVSQNESQYFSRKILFVDVIPTSVRFQVDLGRFGWIWNARRLSACLAWGDLRILNGHLNRSDWIVGNWKHAFENNADLQI